MVPRKPRAGDDDFIEYYVPSVIMEAGSECHVFDREMEDDRRAPLLTYVAIGRAW